MSERRDRLNDALSATRAAVLEGVVAGGGVALARAARALDGLTGANADQVAGIRILQRALDAPLRRIAENAGFDGSVVAGKIRESDDAAYGFDARQESYGDMFAFGVIDPVKIVRTALEAAASVAGLLMTLDAAVAEHEPRHPARAR